jgi:hypothetical protein
MFENLKRLWENLKEIGFENLTEADWFRSGTTGGLLWIQRCIYRFHKQRDVSWLDRWILKNILPRQTTHHGVIYQNCRRVNLKV